MVLGLLLTRCGVEVAVLEKHGDFLRDFRGDTVHASTLTLLDELGLGEAFARLGARYVTSIDVAPDSGVYPMADMSHLPGRHHHLALVPQWDLLDLMARTAARESTCTLLMDSEVTGLTCEGDPAGGYGRFARPGLIVLVDRGDYFQIGYVIKKGSQAELRTKGIEAFRARLVDALPWLGDRVETLGSFDDVSLLSVELGRLRRWCLDGLLRIGDAAHAMSPVGGVGVNLAIQDAAATARLLAPALREHRVRAGDLRRVQRRRGWPTVATQTAQRLAHRLVLARAAEPREPRPSVRPEQTRTPLPPAVVQDVPWLRRIPAYFVSIGVRPERPPLAAQHLTARRRTTTVRAMTVRAQATAARTASRVLARTTRSAKDAALHAMADALAKAETAVLDANAVDVARAEAAETSAALVDRLRLTPDRLAGMADGLRDLAALPDPVGDVVRGWTNANGVEVRQVRVPFGVVGIIYEARPNVTADAAGICLKSGNAVLLRGSSSAVDSNAAVVEALRAGLVEAGLPADAVQLVEGPREVTEELMGARGLVDVLIPRGGAGLIEHVVRHAVVPVIETGVGNCHLFVDASADQDVALRIALNAKTQRPSVCNAIETVLVHAACAEEFMPRLLAAMTDAGVTVHGDQATRAYDRTVVVAREEDFAQEYLSLDLAVAVVADLDAALVHIADFSTGHSETIVTRSQESAMRFTAEVDAAAVLVNASSRFVDGGEFGFGAEIGISTQKLHARGPMGLPEMTSTKYVVTGSGQTR